MNKIFSKIDLRLVWAVRHIVYKTFFGELAGFGYLGSPLFAKGLNRVYVKSGFGMFGNWRVEVLSGTVNIGRNVRIGNNFFMNCGSKITIGNDTVVSANVFVGTTGYLIPGDVRFGFSKWKPCEESIYIGDNVFIGFGSVIMPGCILEEGCVVGANSVVFGRHRRGSVIAGVPAKLLRIREE